MILSCTCQDAYQDQLHGKGLRVMNALATAPQTPQMYRCAKCLKQRGVANTEVVKTIIKVTNTDKK